MKMIAVGDNVVDCYLHQKIYYPGGNAVNVVVNAKRNGAEEGAYIGIFGNDKKAEHVMWALDQEGISYDLSRHMVGITGQPGVNLTAEGDRVFVGGPRVTVQTNVKLRMTQQDLDFISKFDVCHTSCFSFLEPELAKIAERCDISYDFSDYKVKEYMEAVCPHVKYVFFSGSEMSVAEIKELANTCHAMGTEIVGVTRGGKGAMFSKNGEIFEQGIKPIEVVDTMGAGDSFIAGFLTKYCDTKDMAQSLDYAATRAALSCTISGGFGYPHPFDD